MNQQGCLRCGDEDDDQKHFSAEVRGGGDMLSSDLNDGAAATGSEYGAARLSCPGAPRRPTSRGRQLLTVVPGERRLLSTRTILGGVIAGPLVAISSPVKAQLSLAPTTPSGATATPA